MDNDKLNKLIDTWIAFQKLDESGKNENHPDWWAVFELMDLVQDNPEEGYKVILAILDRDQSTEIMEILSAGALEDLLSEHGEDFIERIEYEAKDNSDFSNLLGGVWQNSMSDELYARVQKVWDRRGWDGN